MVPYRRKFPAHTEVEALRALQEGGVAVAPVVTRSAVWSILGPMTRLSEASHEESFPPGDARKYAELTGGQVVGLRGRQRGERLAALIDELRARYTIDTVHHLGQPLGRSARSMYGRFLRARDITASRGPKLYWLSRVHEWFADLYACSE